VKAICSGLDQIINVKHGLVQLAARIDWDWIDAPYSDNGRPGIETRFVIGLLLLKHIYGLTDEGVCEFRTLGSGATSLIRYSQRFATLGLFAVRHTLD
jgi:hypothetical protein